MRRMWMNVVYTLLTENLYKKRSVEIIEYLVFLVQIESLNYYKPFIPYKIYIFNNQIRIPYLSDLLRINKPIYIMYNGYNLDKFDRYLKLFNEYNKMTDDEIKQTAIEVINKGELNKKYFIYCEYNSKKYSYLARITYNRHSNLVLAFICSLAMVFSLSAIICIIITILNMIGFIHLKELVYNKIYFVMIIGIVCILIYASLMIYFSKKH